MAMSDYPHDWGFEELKQQLDKTLVQALGDPATGGLQGLLHTVNVDFAKAEKDLSAAFFPVGSLSQTNPMGDPLGEELEGDGSHNTTYTFHRFYKGEHLRVTSTVSTYKTPTGYWTEVVGGPLDGEHSVADSKIGALIGHKEMCTAVRQISTG